MEQLYRLDFQKTRGARFLSHLDMARLFVRAFRRAKLPLKFSEGFHAHPKVRFTPPLSVGVESLCEYCIFTLLDEVRSEEELLEKIAEGMADGFTLTALTPIDQKPENAPFARYEITLNAGEDAARRAFCAPLTVIKKTKSGEKELDLADFITLEALCPTDGGVIATVLSPSSEAMTINPTLICTALQKKDETIIPARILKKAAVTL